MKHSIIVSLAILTGVASFNANADQIRVATGSTKGTYHALYSDIQGKCSEQTAIVEVPTTGSVENLDKLLNKEVGAAFVQTDVLFASAQGRDLGNIKTLVAFNKESVHVLALTNTGIKVGQTLGFGGHDVVFNNVDDLSGYKVAAASGSLVTAQLIKLQGQVNWIIVPVDSTDSAIAELKAGHVQGAILVGGQPLGNVKQLTSDFKLLSFKDSTRELLKTVYVKDNLSYPKLSSGNTVNSIATESLLVTRTYSTPDKLNMLSNFRQCILSNVANWQDADGAHPAWTQVDPANQGKWSYYSLPQVKPVKK